MHNDSMARGVMRAPRMRGTVASTARTSLAVTAIVALAACNDNEPVQPNAKVRDGGPKSPSAIILTLPGILPEGQTFPAKIGFLTGSAVGQQPKVQVYDKTGKLMAQFSAFPFGEDSKAGVEVALGDVNADGYPDIIAGEGPAPLSPNPSMYAVWDGKTGAFITTGTPYWNTFRGGVRVGAADMDGDGKAEILACLGPGGYATGAYIYKVGNSYPYMVFSTQVGGYPDGWTKGGCRIAAGDINGDAKPELIAVYDGPYQSLLIEDLSINKAQVWKSPMGAQYTGPISVAAGDVNGDKHADVMLAQIGALNGSPPVLIYDGAKINMQGFLPTPTTVKPLNWWWATGLTIAARDNDGDGLVDLLVKPTSGLGSSSFGAWRAPTFATYMLWINETAVTGNGGPIG